MRTDFSGYRMNNAVRFYEFPLISPTKLHKHEMLLTNKHCYLIPTKEIGEANFCQMGLESIEPRQQSTGESGVKVRGTGYVMRRVTWE